LERRFRLLRRIVVGRSRGQARATAPEFFAAIAICYESVVADAMKGVRQHMPQKAAYELVRAEPHRLALAVAAIILVSEDDLVIAHGKTGMGCNTQSTRPGGHSRRLGPAAAKAAYFNHECRLVLAIQVAGKAVSSPIPVIQASTG
jgi:hypothetical protein